ncbi:group 1 glycosyl transferase [Candidatus Magnetomorum sp. HK-1]|nr:group 1 glycosyl transferase [Candidatus Magnetomorum sp. HK-1]
MKIAMIGPTFPFRGGIVHHTTLLYKELIKHNELLFISFKRQYPKVLFPGKSDQDPSRDPLKPEKVFYEIDSLNPLTLENTIKMIKAFAPEKCIFPWWVSFWGPHFWYIATRVKKLTNCEIIVICHNVMEHEPNRLKNFVSKLFLSKADRLITHSKSDSFRLKDLLGKKRIVTAFHPTYAPLCHEKYFPKKKAQDRLMCPGSNVLLFFGFVRPYKGLSILLSALNIICESQTIHLLVVGEFWTDKQKYLAKIDQLGIKNQVSIFDRYIPNENIHIFFSAADLVVQPYLSASGSGVCQLAYGFDCPVIATKMGSLTEVVEHGVNGQLVTPGNVKELADAIIQSLEPETLDYLTQNAMKTKNLFSWNKFVNNIID